MREKRTYIDGLSMPTAIPITVYNLNFFLLQFFLLPHPFLSQIFSVPAVCLLSFSIR